MRIGSYLAAQALLLIAWVVGKNPQGDAVVLFCGPVITAIYMAAAMRKKRFYETALYAVLGLVSLVTYRQVALESVSRAQKSFAEMSRPDVACHQLAKLKQNRGPVDWTPYLDGFYYRGEEYLGANNRILLITADNRDEMRFSPIFGEMKNVRIDRAVCESKVPG